MPFGACFGVFWLRTAVSQFKILKHKYSIKTFLLPTIRVRIRRWGLGPRSLDWTIYCNKLRWAITQDSNRPLDSSEHSDTKMLHDYCYFVVFVLVCLFHCFYSLLLSVHSFVSILASRLPFLPRNAKQSAVMPQYVVCLSVRL